jgi:GNAT superfamily N-acetyltransferase
VTVPMLSFYPLTTERWADFEQLFGANGACGGCWCMWWKLVTRDFDHMKGEANRQAQQRIVASGTVPGILVYAGNEPVGWCAVEPRGNYPRLARSRVMAPVDQAEVWSITCFFIHKRYRRQGLTVQLLGAVAEYIKTRGGKILEGYPVEPKDDRMPAAFAYTGLASAFSQAGFVEVARRSATRPIFRLRIGD